MLRSLLAISAGYITILFFNSFVRFVISVYSKGNFALTGITDLPSPVLMYVIVGAGFLFGLIGGMITCSIINKNAIIEILCLIILIVSSGLISYQLMGNTEPLWYLISAPLLKAAGILTAFYLTSSNANHLDNRLAS